MFFFFKQKTAYEMLRSLLFKQKTAYEMLRSLVGSEMCIRDRYILTEAYEAFNIKYDETTIDQNRHLVEIHQPDGKPDVLQQIEHGALSVVGGYKNLGRLYRGIIESTKRQYIF